MDYELRTASPADLDAIMALETATFATDAWSIESMRSELESAHTHYLCAFDLLAPDELAGYGGLLAPQDSTEAEIQTLAVAPAQRRHGLGRMLMLDLLSIASARGALEVFLEVRADNPSARALYDSLGFKQIAVREKYYQPAGVDAQVMRVTL